MADPKPRVLVAGNQPYSRNTIINLLHAIGYHNTKQAEDGLQAMIKLRIEQFDLVIAESEMPIMDGITLVQEMRADKALATVPILIVFAEAQKENIIAGIQAGANGHMCKPFTAAMLDEKITKILDYANRGG